MNKKKIIIISVIILVLAIAFSIIAFTGIGAEIGSYLKYKIMVPKEIVSFEEKEHITITYTYPLQNEKFDIDVTDEELIKIIKDNINNKKLENYSGVIGLAVMGTYKVELDESTSFAFDYEDEDGYVMMEHNEKQFLTKIEPKILSKIVAIVDEKLTENIQMFKTEKITITNKEGKQIEINRKTAIDYLLEQCKDITSEEIVDELNIVAPDYTIKFNDEVEIFKYNQSDQGFLLKNGNLNRVYGLEGFNTFLENAFENLEEKEKMFTADKITITSKEKIIEITDKNIIEKITTPLIYGTIQARDWLENYDITEEYENGIKVKINTCEFLIPGKIGYVTIGNRYIIAEDKKIKLCFPLQDIEKYVNELLGNKQEKTTGPVSIAI